MTEFSSNKIKNTFKKIIASSRFSDRMMYEKTKTLRNIKSSKKLSNNLQKHFTDAEAEIVYRRLTRAVFLIEPVNEEVTSTKYDVRWSERIQPPDPRWASFEECLLIYTTLSDKLTELLEVSSFREELKLLLSWGKSPHEFPIDYESKKLCPIHTADNVRLYRDSGHLRLLRLRQALLDTSLNPDSQLFNDVFDKIRVKSYLTDRAQTGSFQTNREKRWEAHPNSPQFALRRDCFAVELELIDQLFRFRFFPLGIIRYLTKAGLLGDIEKKARCPVTLEELNFELFAQEVADPTHGKSSYQVGHMNPLKAGEGPEFRHHMKNISWITADGNRIQGHLTLKETRKLLLKISKNYDDLLGKGEISPP